MAAYIWNQPFTQQNPDPRPMSPIAQPAASTNMYYQPGNGYGADRDWNTTPIAGQIREQNPQLAYAQYGQGLGIGDTDSAFNRWFYQQFPRFKNAYGLATLDNPLITIDQFLRTMPGMQGLQQQFQMLSPQARGLNHNSYAPISRWITR
jgi:hypothetical protein